MNNSMPCSILSPVDVMNRGLGYIKMEQKEWAKMSAHDKMEDFKAHFSSSSHLIADIWYDFHNSKSLRLSSKQRG
jgi:hypothetical protein